MLFSSDEGDRTAAVGSNAADDQSDTALDAVSVTTTSTLQDSGSDESPSRYATSSTNHVAATSYDATTRPVGSNRHDASYVCRADGDVAGPPWLPAGGDTYLHGDRLSSLQLGASSLLSLVYDRPSNASQNLATADHVGNNWTAVRYSAPPPPPSSSSSSSSSFSLSSSSTTTAATTSYSPWSSSTTTATSTVASVIQSHVEVNVENSKKGKDVDLYSASHVQDTSNAHISSLKLSRQAVFRPPPIACKHRPAQ